MLEPRQLPLGVLLCKVHELITAGGTTLQKAGFLRAQQPLDIAGWRR